jgi:MFS family permease
VLFIAPWAPKLMQRVAPSRLMQAVTLVLALLFILLGLLPDVRIWFPLRFAIGALTALLWIASEALINDLAEDAWRGRIIGLYTAVGSAGFAAGPLLLILTGSVGMLPFLATCGMILLAGLPLYFVSPRPMAQGETRKRGLWRVFRLAPAIMLTNVVYAAAAESLLTFFPLFGMNLGLSEARSLGLLTIVALGGMTLVLPISWLADRVDRLAMLIACVLGTMVCLLAMPLLVTIPAVAEIYAFVFGGMEGMIYALGVILVGERFKGAMLATATTMFTACWGAGTVLGPFLVGAGMDRFGSDSMALIVCGFFLLYLPLPVASYLRARRR